MNKNKIPKRIFYVWGANEEKKRDVQLCIFSWQQKLPDYEIIEINEESVKYFNFKEELKNNLWFKTVYENHLYAYISDYIRVKVLYENGGIYLDTDVFVLKSFDEYLNEELFVPIQRDSMCSNINLEPAILGGKKGNIILKEVLDFYENKIWKSPIYIIPEIFSYVIEKKYGKVFYPLKKDQKIIKFDDVTLYPERFFIPMRAREQFNINCIEPETTTIHWFGGSWVKDEIIYFMKNKHKVSLSKLVNKCFKKKIYINNSFLKLQKKGTLIESYIDISYVLRFKHKIYLGERFLTLFIFGIEIKLFKH